MRALPRSAATRLFDVAAVARALLVGGVAFLAVVLVQWLARAASLSDEALRLAGLATIIVGNLAILQWFRGAWRGAGERNRAFHSLVLAVCVLAGGVLLIEPLRQTFGLPGDVDARLVLTFLAIPVACAAWRLRPRRQSTG